MNRVQSRNQLAICRSLEDLKLISSVTVDAEHLLSVERLGKILANKTTLFTYPFVDLTKVYLYSVMEAL